MEGEGNIRGKQIQNLCYTVIFWCVKKPTKSKLAKKRRKTNNAPSWELGSFHARGEKSLLSCMKTSHLDGSGWPSGFSHTPTGISPFVASKQAGLSPSLVGSLNNFGQFNGSDCGDPSCGVGTSCWPFSSIGGWWFSLSVVVVAGRGQINLEFVVSLLCLPLRVFGFAPVVGWFTGKQWALLATIRLGWMLVPTVLKGRAMEFSIAVSR